MAVTMTGAAARRVSELRESDPRQDTFFRVMVAGGGCQGFQYVMDVDDAPMDGDEHFELGGQRLVGMVQGQLQVGDTQHACASSAAGEQPP